jgi:hypothetical protein
MKENKSPLPDDVFYSRADDIKSKIILAALLIERNKLKEADELLDIIDKEQDQLNKDDDQY